MDDRDTREPRTKDRRADGGRHGWHRDEATGSERDEMAKQSARGDADTGARKPTSDAAEREPAGQDEPDPTDVRRLASFPIREHLSAFDCTGFP
jgi:hypothetical protein